MHKKEHIIQEIDQLANGQGAYGGLVIGAVSDYRKIESMLRPRALYRWQSDSPSASKEIIDLFVNRGMLPHDHAGSGEDEWIILY